MGKFGMVSILLFLLNTVYLIVTFMFNLDGYGWLFIILPITGIIFGIVDFNKKGKIGIWANALFILFFLFLVYIPPKLLGDS